MALTTNTQANAAGITNVATGVVVTDGGAAAATTFTCGFVPRIVRWLNVTDSIRHDRYEGMTNPGATKQLLAGTSSLETTNGITVGDGTAAKGEKGTFTVAAAIIVASKTHVWEAIG